MRANPECTIPYAPDPQNELQRERQALATSEMHIAEGKQRLDRQVKVVASAQAKGYEFQEGERLVTLMRETIDGWEKHQDMIIARIGYLTAQVESEARRRVFR